MQLLHQQDGAAAQTREISTAVDSLLVGVMVPSASSQAALALHARNGSRDIDSRADDEKEETFALSADTFWMDICGGRR